jgi:hypothetical protein
MRTIALDKSPGAARELRAATKSGHLLLTQGGKPVAYVLPTRFYDEEDIGYMTDPEFWKMVRKWREDKGPTIPLEEVMERLENREREERQRAHGPSRLKTAKKGKRNGTA